MSLVDLRRFALSSTLPESESFYQNCLISYLSGDTEELERLIKCAEAEKVVKPIFIELAKVRVAIRKIESSCEVVEALHKFKADYELEQGELHFVLALYYHVLENFEQAKAQYLLAYRFLKNRCERKANTALFNYYVSQSHLQPHKKFLTDLQFLKQEAERIGDPIALGVVLSSMGHEYNKLGAYQNALVCHEQALENLKADTSTYHYENTIANKCQTLISLERCDEAKFTLEEIEHSSFKEIQGAVVVIRQLLGQSKIVEPRFVDSVWQKKLKYNLTQKKKKIAGVLTDLEEKLLHLVYERARTRAEIIEKLYGVNLPYEATENRFYNLLNRFR